MKAKSVFVIFAWLLAMSLIVPKIDGYYSTCAVANAEYDAPVLVRFLGEGASIVSAMSVLQADRYFHGGAGHIEDECRGILGPVGAETKEEDPGHMHYVKDAAETSRFNILFRMSDALRVTEHIHLQGDDIKEIVPWLYYAVELDPHNIQAYTLIGYYVCDRLGKVDQGIAFLRKGLKKNPDSWEINADLGQIYFKHVKDYEKAAVFLSRADELLKTTRHDKFQERYVLTLLAHSYVELGREADAQILYRRIKELFPDAVVHRK
ncbi:MAG: hypothetical protein P9L88_06735 [Candidatus Tantalella remota]|nr:hypothetical protein [Candidatus Tantalella remota]